MLDGGPAQLLLFGGFLIWAIADRISAGQRAAFGPLGLRSGRTRGDFAAIAAGFVLYALMLGWGHRYLIGAHRVERRKAGDSLSITTPYRAVRITDELHPLVYKTGEEAWIDNEIAPHGIEGGGRLRGNRFIP